MCPKTASLTKQPNFKFHVLFYSIFDFKKAFKAGDINQTFCALINDTFVHPEKTTNRIRRSRGS